MWNDVETTDDLLNFETIADTVVQMIKDRNDQTCFYWRFRQLGSWKIIISKND
jgi:predicted KAP-like P-loop ATPase